MACYTVGLVVGGAVSSAIFYLLGSLWRPNLVTVGILALVLGVIRVFRPNTVAIGGFKVPRNWTAWGVQRFLGAFGVLLGMGVVTTTPSPTMLVIVVWMLHLHSFPLILVTFEAFVAARLLTTAAVLYSQWAAAQDVVLSADAFVDKIARVPRLEAACSIILGLILLI
jgi:hypothetical protein